MKSQFVVILLVLVGILGFVIGYSIAPTDVSIVRKGAPGASYSGGGQASGGYGGGDRSRQRDRGGRSQRGSRW